MRYSDSYDAETEDGPARIRPMDVLLGSALAASPNRSRWQTCPVCSRPAPLFFGDPDEDHWCVTCQVVREHPEIEDGEVRS